MCVEIHAENPSKATILMTLREAGYSDAIATVAMEQQISEQTLSTLQSLAGQGFSDDFIRHVISQNVELSDKQAQEIIGLKQADYEESLILLTLPESTQPTAVMKSDQSPGKKPVVLVLDFVNDTRLNNVSLGPGIADMITTALLETGKFRVVERGETFRKIMEEQQLQLTGLVNAGSAAEIGNVLGATHVITGKVTEFGIRKKSATVGFVLGGGGKKTITARVVLDARLVNVSTVEAERAGSGIGESSSEVNAGYALPVNFEVGTTGFDETTIGQATRRATQMVVNKLTP